MKIEKFSMSSTFGGRVMRTLPATAAGAFCAMGVMLPLSALLKGHEVDLRRVVLTALAFSCIVSGLMVPALGYSFRRSEGITKGSPLIKRLFVSSLSWSVLLSGLGFFLFGCSGIASYSCLSTSNLQISATVALASGAFLSLMVLSS